MAKFNGAFYQDLESNLKDPEFAALFELEGMRIKLIDDLINQLDDLRMLEGISKMDLARKLQVEPANIRRFFTSKKRNPTITSVVDLALSLGYKLTLEPLSRKELKELKPSKPMKLALG
jgi:ribosome-binding protein aMBF1 (putative translation factor)